MRKAKLEPEVITIAPDSIQQVWKAMVEPNILSVATLEMGVAKLEPDAISYHVGCNACENGRSEQHISDTAESSSRDKGSSPSATTLGSAGAGKATVLSRAWPLASS